MKEKWRGYFWLPFQLSNKILDQNTERTGFMRKGQTGNWRKHLTPEMVAKFEAWEEKWLKDTDFKPVFDI